MPDVGALQHAARGRAPREGFGGLVIDEHNALSGHAQPALDAIERWLVGNAIDEEAQALIGLGPGLTPSGDDYLGGVLLALHYFARKAQAHGLWRWLEPRLARTSDVSAAHVAAAAAGEGHETLHLCLETLCTRRADWPAVLAKLKIESPVYAVGATLAVIVGFLLSGLAQGLDHWSTDLQIATALLVVGALAVPFLRGRLRFRGAEPAPLGETA